MNERLLPLLAILFSLGFHSASFAENLPDYIRFAEDGKSARLEVAVKTFRMPSGQTVDLIAVVHIADGTYYRELNTRFESYDSVLFELVGDPKSLTAYVSPTPAQPQQLQGVGAITQIQQAVGTYLKLTFQLDGIDYTGKNMVHADTTAEEFQKLQAQRGETMMTLFTRAMQAQMRGQVDRSAMSEFDTLGLIRILLSRDSAAAFKRALAKMLAQMESLSAAMEGEDGSVVLSGRNDVVLAKVKEVLAVRKQRRIAVFYGAAHMPGIESSLNKNMNAKAAGEEWLAAWTMPKEQPGAVSGQP